MFIPYLSAGAAVIRSNFRRLDRPYKLTLALTYRCNFRCRSCRTWQRPPAGEMTLEELEKFFRRQNYLSWVDLTGGEVSLRPDLPDILALVSDCSPGLILLHFPTNGYLPERIIRAARAVKRRSGLKFIITVSLDGPPEVHDRLKGMPGSWERALETFGALRREKGVEVFFGMTLQRENLSLLRETVAAAQKKIPSLKNSDFHFNLAQSSFFYDNLEEDPSPGPAVAPVLAELIRGYRFFPSPRKFLERAYLKRTGKFVRDDLCPLPCRALSSSCFIEPDGKVYPCTGYGYCLGNLRETGFDLEPIWHSPGASVLQKEIDHGLCPQCWTPCEAYQTILGNLFRRGRGGGNNRFTPRVFQRDNQCDPL